MRDDRSMCDDSIGDEEELIRYHFGEMTKAESTHFEHRLANEPGLERRLEKLRDCLSSATRHENANADDQDSNLCAPKGLADRVADSVADLRLEDLHATPHDESATDKTPSHPCRFSFLDAAAAIFAIGLIALLVSPSLLDSREAERRIQCQNNLAKLGRALQHYAFDHGKQFPYLHPYENAGMFTVSLAESGYLSSENLQQLVVCPASRLADEIMNRTAIVWVPSRYEFQTSPALLAERAKQFMSGSYAYRIGYFENGVYLPVEYQGDSRSPLLCDAPAPSCVKQMSPHHTAGQNILFQDGSIKFQTSCQSPCRQDHLFLNHDGQVAAGQSWQDAVLVRSEVTPWPFSTVDYRK